MLSRDALKPFHVVISNRIFGPLSVRSTREMSSGLRESSPSLAFSLYAKMALAMGVVFQMPTLVLFLARMGMVTAGFLLRQTKYAILIIFVVAAVLTPSPDAVSQLLMAGPMILLYGLSILVAWVFGRRRLEPPAGPETPEN